MGITCPHQGDRKGRPTIHDRDAQSSMVGAVLAPTLGAARGAARIMYCPPSQRKEVPAKKITYRSMRKFSPEHTTLLFSVFEHRSNFTNISFHRRKETHVTYERGVKEATYYGFNKYPRGYQPGNS